MILYLVRHGEAGGASTDAARPLTEHGRREIVKVAREAARRGVRVDAIRHSRRLRAEQSAALIAESLDAAAATAISGLDPGDDVVPIAVEIQEDGVESLMLVGHLPFMGCLAGFLLTGDEDRAPVSFTTATMARLDRDSRGWKLVWAISPGDP